MMPWNWYWPFQIHFPLSGNVSQKIDPEFKQIATGAGNAQLEEKISNDVHSYGRQLDKIITLLLALSANQQFAGDNAVKSASDALQKMNSDIDAVKSDYYKQVAENIKISIRKLEKSDPDGYKSLVNELKNL